MTSAPSTPGTPLRYFVERMDCADCARTVQSALTRLPGVDAPQVNFTTQTLSLTLDEAQMPRERLEQTLRSLGYPPTLEAAPADATHWSTRPLARATGLSQTAVCRIWRAFALKPV